jgi:hypothetical protein
VAVIDLYASSNPAATWTGKEVLVLASDYTAGNLSALKTRFALGNFILISGGSYTVTPITGYVIGDDGKLTAAP